MSDQIETQDDGPRVSFDEIRALVREFPGPDQAAATAVLERQRRLTKPPGSLGRLEDLAEWLASWQGRSPPRVRRPNVSVFAASHGIAAQGVSAYPPEVTAQMVKNFIDGGAAINQLCRTMDAELKVYELAVETPTQDFTQAPAMDEEECGRAMAYGMMAVEQGLDLLALGEMGIGNTTAASALAAALFGGTAADWVGPGTGVTGDAFARKTAAVEAGLTLHGNDLADPLEALRRLGGFELAAITGAVMAARIGRVPVLLDGFASTVAAAVVARMAPGGLDHTQIAHLSAEPAHARLCEALGKRPLLDLGMRLGEGSGAALAIGIVRCAAETHSGMATFEQAGISGPG